MHLRNVPDLVSTYIILQNICIIFYEEFGKTEWTQEAIDEVHIGMAANMVPRTTTRERLAIANHALQDLAGIDDNNMKTLEYIKQEATNEFQIAMGIVGKTSKELCAKKNGIAWSLWMAKTKACIAETFTHDNV